jgi:hypothetical protein
MAPSPTLEEEHPTAAAHRQRLARERLDNVLDRMAQARQARMKRVIREEIDWNLWVLFLGFQFFFFFSFWFLGVFFCTRGAVGWSWPGRGEGWRCGGHCMILTPWFFFLSFFLAFQQTCTCTYIQKKTKNVRCVLFFFFFFFLNLQLPALARIDAGVQPDAAGAA